MSSLGRWEGEGSRMSGSSDKDRPSEDGEARAEALIEPEGDGQTQEAPRVVEQPAPQPRSRGILGGAVAGAVVAALTAYALHASGWLDRSDPSLNARLGSLESRIADASAATGGLDQRVTAVEQRPAPAQPDLTPLQQATTSLRDEATALGSQLTTLGTQISSLRDDLAKQSTAAETARNALDEGLRGLRETVGGLSLSLSEQRARIDTLASQKPDLQPLTDGLKAAQATLDAQSGKISDLAGRVQSLEDSLVGARRSAAESTRVAMALVELDRAFGAGEPLAAALAPFEPFASDPGVKEPLDTLQPFASDGPPTVADLQASLATLRPKIAEAVRFSGSSDWVGRTATNLAGLVDLHRVDDAEAAATAELDKAEQALARGDVAAAAAVMQPLADSGNEGAAAWLAQVRSRLDAAAAVDQLRSYIATNMPAAP